MTTAMATMGHYPIARGYQPNFMQDGGNAAYYVDRGYAQNPYYFMQGAATHGENFHQALEDENEMLRRHHRNAQKPPRPGQQRSYVNNFVQPESHDEPPSGQSKYGPVQYSQSIITNNMVDEYGEEMYHPGMISHMSQMANPGSNFFASEAKRAGARANSKYGGKRNKQRPNKSKKNKNRKKYSSDEDAPEYDRHRYHPGGFVDDDINQRANIADYSNYRDSKSDADYNSNSSGSSDSDSNSSSSSEASSATKQREEEKKKKDKKAKESLKKANKSKREKDKYKDKEKN